MTRMRALRRGESHVFGHQADVLDQSWEGEMATVTVEVPNDTFSALRRSPKEFARDIRIAAAIQWYHQRLISQGKAAAIAGLSRKDFLMALYHAKVEASQVDIEEMMEEVERDLQARRERLAPDLPDRSGAP
jgi:predicted HTH domain antitoxin